MNARLASLPVLTSFLCLGAAGCGGSGGGGGGGDPGTTKRTFVIPHVLETSGSCTRVAVGDVNGDGVEDLLVHQADQSTVQLMLADVEPGEALSPRVPSASVPYRSAGHVLVWSSASDLCVGDVNGDGCTDLVVAGGDANAVGLWACDGSTRSRFLDPLIVALDCPATRVAVGDVNGDGTADLVCLDESQGRVRYCIQDPALRTFTVDASPPDIGACFGLVCCDLDRDGHLDLVTNRPAADGIRVLSTYSASGVISPRDHASGLPTGRCMAVGDVDGDGRLDVCVLAEGGRSVVCLHQRTTEPGAFDPVTSPLSIAIDEAGVHVCVPAVQRRGVVAGCGNGNYCPTSPQGHLAAGISIDEPGVHFAEMCIAQPGLALADLDGDGRLDLCARCADGTGDVSMCYGSHAAPATFAGGERQSSGGWSGPLCAAADLDGDGTLDLVGCSPAAHTVNPLYVQPTSGGENPLYEPKGLRQLPFLVADVAVDDLDGDGHVDLACATPAGVQICYGDGTGALAQPVLAGLANGMGGIAVGDVNGDGWPDIVSVGGFTQSCLSQGATGSPRVYDILSSAAIPGACRDVALGDVNRDGIPDLVGAFDNGGYWAPGLGGGFTAYEALPTSVTDPRGCAIADLDSDGRLDVCLCGTDRTEIVMANNIPIFGMWRTGSPVALAGGVRVAAGDVNGDGRCDVCVTGDAGAVCALQDASSSFRGSFLGSHALSREECGGIVIGDLNGDGRLDLTFVETKTGLLRCENGGPNDDSPFSLRLNGLPPGEPVLGTLTVHGDLDGDGVLEVLTVGTVLGTPGATVRSFSRVASAP